MSLNTFLTIATQGLYVTIALITFAEYVRHRDRLRLEIALLFTAFAALFLLQNVTAVTQPAERWGNLATGLILVAHPYLLLRVVEHFRPVSAVVRWLGLAGLSVSAFFLLLFDFTTSLPLPLAIFIVVYFVCLETYAALAFVRGALQDTGVTRWRLGLAAIASGLLALLIFLAGVNRLFPLPPGLLPLSGRLFAILAGLFYFLGFATPRWLRRWWQYAELVGFLHTSGIQPAPDQEKVLHTLCHAARRGAGGVAALLLQQKEDNPLPTCSASTHPLEQDIIHLTVNDLPTHLWLERKPLLIAALEPDTGMAHLARHFAANIVYVAPVLPQQQAWGLLLVFRQGPSLFATDDLDLLALFTGHVASMLRYTVLINELQQRTAQMEIANRDLEAFSYSVSHDLRAPLRAIDSFSQIVLEECYDQLNADGRDYLQRIRTATRRIGQLTEDLLKMAHVSRTEMRHEWVNLGALAQSISETLQTAQQERQATFNIAQELMVQGDGRLLYLVLENLLGNAWKYTGQRQQAYIELGATEQNGQCIYFVRDNGAGFDMAYVSKLFNPFQRLHKSSEFPGTGIGLATVQRIIQRHGGQVWAESVLEQGATFYFTLP